MDNQQLQIPQEVQSFLESLLNDAGMTLDESLKGEMINELYARLDNFITSTIIDTMPQDKIEDFISLNEQKKPKEEIEKFIADNIPNAQEVFAKAFTDFRSLYLGGVAVDRNVSPQDKNVQEKSETSNTGETSSIHN